ncbi:MAG: MFS transporter [Gammaproteobacteria bacterium]
MAISPSLRRNVLILSGCQALMLSGSSLMIATSALIGFALSEDKLWATLPIGCLFLGTLLSTYPASMIMKRIGRRAGFMIGPIFGVAGAVLTLVAIMDQSFALFSAGSFLIGVLNGVGYYYRFAAADISDDVYRSRAISWVLVGGVLAAFIGPNLASFNRDLISGYPFAGSYASLIVVYALSVVLASRLDIPKPGTEERAGRQRSLWEIARQPTFLVAVVSAMVAYGVMNLVMTSTPLAMAGHNHSFSDTALVIQWHVIAMFTPSFFTGHLIARFGTLRVMAAGAIVLFASVAVALHGISVTHFVVALIFLGLGWNFLFIGATHLVTQSYVPAEKAKTQGLNDLLVFSTVALTALTSGMVHEIAGWEMLNELVLPAIGVALGAILLLGWFRRQSEARAT